MKKLTVNDCKKWNYGQWSTDNYGAQTIAIQLGTRTVYYSYDTIVAFNGTNSKGEEFNCVVQNTWGRSTGKHLNWIDGGHPETRLAQEAFDKKLKEFLK